MERRTRSTPSRAIVFHEQLRPRNLQTSDSGNPDSPDETASGFLPVIFAGLPPGSLLGGLHSHLNPALYTL